MASAASTPPEASTLPIDTVGDGGAAAAVRAVACLTITCHPDRSRIGERATIEPATTALVSRTSPEFGTGAAPGRPLAEHHVSRSPVALYWTERAGLSVEPARAGLIAIDGVACDAPCAIAPDQVAGGVHLVLARRVGLWFHVRHAGPAAPRLELVGDSDGIDEVRRAVDRVAGLEAPVSLRGETGVGKELVARAIHAASPRRDRPFVAVNMATLAAATAASELFGHVKGAFTGAASRHAGLFERADGGTLFLDEIGETPEDVQAMLLRVLETGSFLPVGATAELRADVRLLTATDADLERAARAGGFRAALLHRVAGYQIAIPALRDRRDDIPALVAAFLAADAPPGSPAAGARSPLTPAVMDRLMRHAWPGNVRQLRNVIRQLALATEPGGRRDVERQLDRLLVEPAPAASAGAGADGVPTAASSGSASGKTDLGADRLRAALAAHDWAPGPTAAALGMPRPTFYDLLARAGIRTARDLDDDELRACYAACGGDVAAMVTRLQVSRRGVVLRLRALGLDA